MKRGMARGLMTGILIGGTAATMFGIMNWQTERKWNRRMYQGGKWISKKADRLMKHF